MLPEHTEKCHLNQADGGGGQGEHGGDGSICKVPDGWVTFQQAGTP